MSSNGKKSKKTLDDLVKPPELSQDPKVIWAQEERARRIRDDKTISDNSPYADDRGAAETEDKDLKDAWNQLAAVAKIKFPEKYASKFQLVPRKRLVAIATVLEWGTKQIAAASGFSETSIYRWLKEPSVMEFMEAFEHFRGSKDGGALIDQELYASVMAMKEIRDDRGAPAAVRKDIAKFFIEMKLGKAKETIENKGLDIKSFTEQLRDLKKKDIVEIELPEEDPRNKLVN